MLTFYSKNCDFYRNLNLESVSGSEFSVRPHPRTVQFLTANNSLIIEAIDFKFYAESTLTDQC